MKITKTVATNGRIMYFQVIEGKKRRISKDVALANGFGKKEPQQKVSLGKSKSTQPKSVEDVLNMKPRKSGVKVNGFLVSTVSPGKGKATRSFYLADSLEETYPPQAGDPSIKFVLTSPKASDLIVSIKKDKKIKWDESTGEEFTKAFWTDSPITLDAYWDSSREVKISTESLIRK